MKVVKKLFGLGCGCGVRKLVVLMWVGEDVDMVEMEGEVDVGEGGVDEGDEEEEE